MYFSYSIIYCIPFLDDCSRLFYDNDSQYSCNCVFNQFSKIIPLMIAYLLLALFCFIQYQAGKILFLLPIIFIYDID